MRKGFDGLGGLIRSEMASDPMDGGVYLLIDVEIGSRYWYGQKVVLYCIIND
jgi:hypothetical protein